MSTVTVADDKVTKLGESLFHVKYLLIKLYSLDKK